MSQPATTAAVASPVTGRNLSRLSYRLLPILGASKRVIRDLGARVTLSTSRVAEIAVADPGLALQLLCEANRQSQDGSSMDVTGVSHAVSLLGMEQTLGLVSGLRTVEAIKPRQRREGLLHAMARAAHASGLARDWSRRRGEQAAEVAALAVLVRHAAELALWSGDAEARELFAHLHHAGDDRARLEIELIGCPLSELGERLAIEACVPVTLRAAVDDSAALQARLAPCVLASALATAVALDWHSPRSRELVSLYADLSGSEPDRAIATLHSQTADIARRSPLGHALSAARYLLLPPGERFDAEELAPPLVPAVANPTVVAATATPEPTRAPVPASPPTPAAPKVVAVRPVRAPAAAAPVDAARVTPPPRADDAARPAPQMASPASAQPGEPAAPTPPEIEAIPARRSTKTEPAVDAVVSCQRLLADVRRGATTIQAALPAVIDSMREGLGFERAVFALKHPEQAALRARYTSGSPSQPTLAVDLSRSNVVTRLLQGSQGIWLHAGTRTKLWPYLPRSIRAYAGDRNFCIMSLFVRDRGVGIIYADYAGGQVDEQTYARFRRIVVEVADALSPRRAPRG